MIQGKLVFIALTLVSFAAGITSRFSFPILVVFILISQRLFIQKSRPLLIGSLGVILLFSLRFSDFESNETLLTLAEDEWVHIAVKQTSWKVDGDKLEFEGSVQVDGSREKVRVTYFIADENEKQTLTAALPRSIVAKGTLSHPEGPSNFNQFNYETHLKNKSIFNMLKVSELFIPEFDGEHNSHPYKLDSLRQSILSHIDRTMCVQTGAYTKTLLFADKRSFSSEVMDSFKDLGIVHLLSISGLHVVLIIDFIRLSLLRMKVSKETTATTLILLLPLYGVTTGFGVSVLRAIGQSWIKLSGEKLGMSITSLDSWSIMLIVTLFIKPYSLYTIGFQLSFLISLFIILLAHQSFFKHWNSVQRYIGMNLLLLLVSVPVLSYHFYEFSWGVLLLNIIFVPFVASLLLPLLILSLLLSVVIPYSVLFNAILFLIDKLTFAMELVINIVATNFTFTFVTGRLSLSAYFLLTVAIIVLVVLIEKNKPKRSWSIPAFTIILCVLSVRYSPTGQVLMIDVNQGEAILIKEPWGRGNYLIDTGGQIDFPVEEWQKREKMFKVGENILLPVLKSEGVNKLESVIITHPDIDHYGALLDILSEIKTEQVVSAKATFRQENFQVLFPSIESYGTIIKDAAEGSNTDLPRDTFAVLSSSEMNSLSKNDSSLVLYGMIGSKTWLFTGDLEAEGEKALLAKYPEMTVDVLKVGHHGSQTSTHKAFIDQLRPEIAWISSGKSNRYGHPHDSVVEKLTERDIDIYRTDTHGAVRYRFTSPLPLINVNSNLFSFEHKRELRGE